MIRFWEKDKKIRWYYGSNKDKIKVKEIVLFYKYIIYKKHPEVYVCLLISLYAGKCYKIYKYSYFYLYEIIVKKLYIWANQQEIIIEFICFIIRSSETIRDNILSIKKRLLNNIISSFSTFKGHHDITYLLKNTSRISEHVPKHKKPINNKELGHYLAGLIDGNSSIDNKYKNKEFIPYQTSTLIIYYDSKDIQAAYWLKSQLGYGRVLKNKNFSKLIINHPKGLLKILDLINGKLKTHYKFNIIKNNLYINHNDTLQNVNTIFNDFKIGDINDFDNYWLCGFIDAIGIFHIDIHDNEVRLKLELSYLNKDTSNEFNSILDSIRLFLCSNINLKGCYIKSLNKGNMNIDTLETTSYKIAKNLIIYLNKYHLVSCKYINYLNFRKAYLLIQDKKHLNEEGFNKLISLQKKINSLHIFVPKDINK